MDNKKKSIDAASLKMIDKACRDCVETVWDRYEAQQPQCAVSVNSESAAGTASRGRAA